MASSSSRVRQPADAAANRGREHGVVGLRLEAVDPRGEELIETGAALSRARHGLGVPVADHPFGERGVDVVHLLDLLQPEAEDIARHADRERIGIRRAQLSCTRVRARAAGLHHAEQIFDPTRDEVRELSAYGGVLERLGKRPAMARVLVPVDDQHLPTQYHVLRVVRDVDHEPRRIHLQLVEQGLAGNEPHALFGEPGHRLALAQPVQQRRVVVALELVGLDTGPKRESLHGLRGLRGLGGLGGLHRSLRNDRWLPSSSRP